MNGLTLISVSKYYGSEAVIVAIQQWRLGKLNMMSFLRSEA